MHTHDISYDDIVVTILGMTGAERKFTYALPVLVNNEANKDLLCKCWRNEPEWPESEDETQDAEDTKTQPLSYIFK